MRRSLAQLVALIFGVIFILVAVLGFITPGGMAMAMAAGVGGGMLLGLFAINLIHNVVHLLFGLWGVAASRTFAAAKGYCQAVGVIYLVLAVLGYLAPTGFGLVPIGGNNIWLHAVLGIVLTLVGFTAKPVATNS
jgi:hypothetical protein